MAAGTDIYDDDMKDIDLSGEVEDQSWDMDCWDLHREFVLRFVRRQVPFETAAELDASDVTQEVLLAAERFRDQFRGQSLVQYQAWLIRIASNKIVDALRRIRPRRCPDEMIDVVAAKQVGQLCEDTPSRMFGDAEVQAMLMKSVDDLPADIRQIVRMYMVERMTFAAIGEQLEMPATTCRRRWLEGVEILAVTLKPMLV